MLQKEVESLKQTLFEKELEKMMQAPCYEAAFALDKELSCLKLYDCLIPNITTTQMYKYLIENDRKIKSDKKVPEEDQLSILKQELAKVKQEFKKIKHENKRMSEKIYVQNNRLEIVNWYIDVMEEGQDNFELAGLYAKLKIDNKNLQ